MNTIAEIDVITSPVVQKELARWQNEISTLLVRLCGSDQADGSGSDGDELAFTLAEISDAFALKEANQWKPISEYTENMSEVIGYSEKWIDPDFNPRGTRVCFLNADGWISSKRCDYHEVYQECRKPPPPTEFMLIPER